MRQAISQNANSANDITSISVKFLKEHNYRLSVDQLLDIKNALDTEQLLALVNQAKLTPSELLQILPEMDSPYCNILSQSNVSIKNTYNNKKFIKRLFLFGIIKAYNIGNGKIEIAIKE